MEHLTDELGPRPARLHIVDPSSRTVWQAFQEERALDARSALSTSKEQDGGHPSFSTGRQQHWGTQGSGAGAERQGGAAGISKGKQPFQADSVAVNVVSRASSPDQPPVRVVLPLTKIGALVAAQVPAADIPPGDLAPSPNSRSVRGAVGASNLSVASPPGIVAGSGRDGLGASGAVLGDEGAVTAGPSKARPDVQEHGVGAQLVDSSAGPLGDRPVVQGEDQVGGLPPFSAAHSAPSYPPHCSFSSHVVHPVASISLPQFEWRS